jgi:hypothetical protein
VLHFEETSRQVELAGRVADFCPVCRDLRPFTVRARLIVRENVVLMFGFPFCSILTLFGLAFGHMNRRSKLSRVLRLEVYPLLGRALKPLNPSAEELDQVIQELRRGRLVSGGLLNRGSVVAGMNCLR